MKLRDYINDLKELHHELNKTKIIDQRNKDQKLKLKDEDIQTGTTVRRRVLESMKTIWKYFYLQRWVTRIYVEDRTQTLLTQEKYMGYITYYYLFVYNHRN